MGEEEVEVEEEAVEAEVSEETLSEDLESDDSKSDEAGEVDEGTDGSGKRILNSLKDTELGVRIVVCEQEFEVGDLMGMGPGTILVLDSPVQFPAWATVNGKRFAYGKIVQIGECYGFQIEKLK